MFEVRDIEGNMTPGPRVGILCLEMMEKPTQTGLKYIKPWFMVHEWKIFKVG